MVGASAVDQSPQARSASVARAALRERMRLAACSLSRTQEGSTATLEYTGPPKIKFGIELALKDSPLIDTVEFL